MIFDNACQLIGGTPLLALNKFCEKNDTKGKILAKLECFNPGGSIKDRAALYMIDEAERSGKLKKGGTIIEPTSGNTGVGLALIAAARGYNAIFVMPDTMSIERQQLMKAYGAQVVLSPGGEGMKGAVDKAMKLAANLTDSFIPAQFKNPANAMAHFETTGPEIYAAANGKIDAFVAGVGSGGTITGTGRYLKSQNPDIKVIAVEPEASPLLSQNHAGKHKIQGIGANFVPELLDTMIYDEVITVSDDDAYKFTRLLAADEGILCGISSGAALCAAAKIASRPAYSGKNIVVVFPDTGERYLSSGVFN